MGVYDLMQLYTLYTPFGSPTRFLHRELSLVMLQSSVAKRKDWPRGLNLLSTSRGMKRTVDSVSGDLD